MMKITKSQLKEMVKEVVKEQTTLPPERTPTQSFKLPVSKSGSIEITDGENLTSNEKSALDKMSTTLINNVTTKKSALKLLTILQKSIEEGFFDKKLKEFNGASRTVSESKENMPSYEVFKKKYETLSEEDKEEIVTDFLGDLRSRGYRSALYYATGLPSPRDFIHNPEHMYKATKLLLTAPEPEDIYLTSNWRKVSTIVDDFDRDVGYDESIAKYAKSLGKSLLHLFKNKTDSSKIVSESKNIPHYKEFEKKFEKLTKQDIENIAKFHRNSLRSLVNNLAWYYSDLLYSSNSLALEFDDPIDLYETIEALLSAPPVDSIYDTPKWNRVSGVVEEFDRKFGGHDNAKAIDEYAKQLGKDLLQVVNQFSNK